METRGRLAAVDYGTKRVGIALADPLRLFAQPYGTFDPRTAVEQLKRIKREQGLEKVVVGWPLLLDGTEGEATNRVREYVNRLRNALPGTDVITWDERYTSEIASKLLREAHPKRRISKREGVLDAAAAAVILQDFLER